MLTNSPIGVVFAIMDEKEFYKKIGKRLAALREKAGLKQKEVAEKIGVSPSVISEAEKDGKKLSAYRIYQILDALGFSHADLFETEKKKTSILPFPRTV